MIPPRILTGSRLPSPFRTVLRFRNLFPDFRSLGFRLSCVVEIAVSLGLGILLVSSDGIHHKFYNENPVNLD